MPIATAPTLMNTTALINTLKRVILH